MNSDDLTEAGLPVDSPEVKLFIDRLNASPEFAYDLAIKYYENLLDEVPLGAPAVRVQHCVELAVVVALISEGNVREECDTSRDMAVARAEDMTASACRALECSLDETHAAVDQVEAVMRQGLRRGWQASEQIIQGFVSYVLGDRANGIERGRAGARLFFVERLN